MIKFELNRIHLPKIDNLLINKQYSKLDMVILKIYLFQMKRLNDKKRGALYAI